MCSSTSMPISGLNLNIHFSGWAGIGLKGGGIKTAPGLLHGDWAIVELLVNRSVEDDPCSWEDEGIMILDDLRRGVVVDGWMIWNEGVGG